MLIGLLMVVIFCSSCLVWVLSRVSRVVLVLCSGRVRLWVDSMICVLGWLKCIGLLKNFL